VVVSGAGKELSVSATNVCGRWRRGGRIPGVTAQLAADRSGEVIGLDPSSATSGTYRVTVRVAGRVVRRAVLHLHTLG
jgi:hypothetical protein